MCTAIKLKLINNKAIAKNKLKHLLSELKTFTDSVNISLRA